MFESAAETSPQQTDYLFWITIFLQAFRPSKRSTDLYWKSADCVCRRHLWVFLLVLLRWTVKWSDSFWQTSPHKGATGTQTPLDRLLPLLLGVLAATASLVGLYNSLEAPVALPVCQSPLHLYVNALTSSAAADHSSAPERLHRGGQPPGITAGPPLPINVLIIICGVCRAPYSSGGWWPCWGHMKPSHTPTESRRV